MLPPVSSRSASVAFVMACSCSANALPTEEISLRTAWLGRGGPLVEDADGGCPEPGIKTSPTPRRNEWIARYVKAHLPGKIRDAAALPNTLLGSHAAPAIPIANHHCIRATL